MAIKECDDRELLEGFTTTLTETKNIFDTRLVKIESDIRTLKQRSYRPPFMGDGSCNGGGDGIGALVVKVGRFQTLQSAGRGIAQVSVNRRLVTKATITMGANLKPGVAALPIAELPGPAPSVADLIPQRRMSEGSLQFVRQKAPHPVAGVQVNEGDVKQEGTFAFETVTLAPATLAIWVAASRQSLRDIGGLQLLIDTELLYAVKTLEESEFLNGDGTEGHLSGLVPAATALAPVAGDSPLDSVARAIGALAASGIQASGVVMHPTDWLNVMLSKNTTEDYLLGSPATATATVVWGVPLALSTQIAAGTFLVGNFVIGCELAYREFATIDISTEHADFFARNLICIRAEESLALAVKQPSCFVKSTFPAPTGLRSTTPATTAAPSRK